jgi:GT2 family glycosyltransferase
MSNSFILIPAHNRRALTLGCLASLRATDDLSRHSVIVIDDGSTDGTGDAVRADFPEVIVVRGDGSLFWTGAIALGMREAAARRAGPLFWLNDDCRPRPGALARLGEFLAAEPDAIAGPRCLDAHTGGAVPTGFIDRKTFSAPVGTTRTVEGLSGFCVGLGARVAPRFGPPDARNFPHYFADTAYTLLAHRAGARVVVLGDAAADLVDYRGEGLDLRADRRPGETWARHWSRVFTATASPYRLRTLFAAQQLKYGNARGTALATARAAERIARFVLARIG